MSDPRRLRVQHSGRLPRVIGDMGGQQRGVVCLLLGVQASLLGLSAAGLVAYAVAGDALGALLGPESLAIAGALALVLLAVGLARGSRWARRGVLVFEATTLLGAAVQLLASHARASSLTGALTLVVLPLAVVLASSLPKAALTRDRLAAGLLVAVGLVHLAIAPDHLQTSHALGQLFVLDGVAAIGLGLVSLRTTWWRRPAAVLLAASIVAYWIVLARRAEGFEDLAVATKLLEIVALGAVLGSARRWVGPVVLATVLTGAFAWGAQLRGGPDHDQHAAGTVGQLAAPPNDAQRAAAEQLVEDTRAGIARYADLDVALQDGYRPSTPPSAKTVHYMNRRYQQPSRDALDTLHPPELVYANTAGGPLLLGAMYLMPKAGVPGLAIGGSLTEWHVHPNLCFLLLPSGPMIDGFATPFGTCPVGSINAPTPAMLHVWIVANPAGPFGDLSPAYVARLTRS